MAGKPILQQVEIFGQTYSVRGGPDPDYVKKLAAFVDQNMREVSRDGGAVDSLKIAVLAALNIADECFRLREGSGQASQDLEARASELARILDSALAE